MDLDWLISDQLSSVCPPGLWVDEGKGMDKIGLLGWVLWWWCDWCSLQGIETHTPTHHVVPVSSPLWSICFAPLLPALVSGSLSLISFVAQAVCMENMIIMMEHQDKIIIIQQAIKRGSAGCHGLPTIYLSTMFSSKCIWWGNASYLRLRMMMMVWLNAGPWAKCLTSIGDCDDDRMILVFAMPCVRLDKGCEDGIKASAIHHSNTKAQRRLQQQLCLIFMK